jgi:hypothetical protein
VKSWNSNRRYLLCQAALFLVAGWLAVMPPLLAAEELPLSLEPAALAVIYSGREKMHFSLSWSGGIKIGDLYMTVSPASSGKGLAITARVTDYGLFKLFYPVDDTFTTFVRDERYLPYRYEVHQIEGSSMDVQRLFIYNQQTLTVLYQKNKNSPQYYAIDGTVYNEFSSFFITRALVLNPVIQQIVPTFADNQRHKVAVQVFTKEKKNTIFGKVDTIKVMPRMSFKGLYDKDGDTLFWLTDNSCRIPVEINSKIMVGSLVARLVEYSNPACTLISQ